MSKLAEILELEQKLVELKSDAEAEAELEFLNQLAKLSADYHFSLDDIIGLLDPGQTFRPQRVHAFFPTEAK